MVTSQNATAPKPRGNAQHNERSLVTSQNTTAPKPRGNAQHNERSLVTSQNATAPKQASGWTIEVTDSDLSAQFAFDNLDVVYGVTDPSTNCIYISAATENAHEVTVHEMGHWLDLYFDSPSKTKEFERAICADNSLATCAIIEPYTSSRQELFAEVFEAYIKRTDEMQVVAPHLYEFIDQYAQAKGAKS